MASKKQDGTSKLTIILMIIVILCAIGSLISFGITSTITTSSFIISQITIIVLSLIVVFKEAIRRV